MKLRSLLFVPADGAAKIAKAEQVGADGLLFDLEDSVVPGRKAAARREIAAHLADPRESGPAAFVRINALDSGEALADLVALMPVAPALRGIMLPKACGPEDLARLSHYLDLIEAQSGLAANSLSILPVVTETARAVQRLGSLTEGPHTTRLVALTWGGEDLSTDLGAGGNRREDGAWEDVFRLARAGCLLAAASCKVPAIDTLHADFRDAEGLGRACAEARRAGFSGKIAIHPAQVAPINAAFTPTEAEIAAARAVATAFAEAPDAGVIGLNGVMYDRPHLLKALRILAQGDAEPPADSPKDRSPS